MYICIIQQTEFAQDHVNSSNIHRSIRPELAVLAWYIHARTVGPEM